MNYKKLRRLCSMAAVVLVLFSALVLLVAANDVQLPENSVLPCPVPLTIGYTALTDIGQTVSTYSILDSLTPTDSSTDFDLTVSSYYDSGDSARVMFFDDISLVYIHAEDFYCWSENTFLYDYNWDSEFVLRILSSDTYGLDFYSARIVLGTVGSTDRHVLDISSDDSYLVSSFLRFRN